MRTPGIPPMAVFAALLIALVSWPAPVGAQQAPREAQQSAVNAQQAPVSPAGRPGGAAPPRALALSVDSALSPDRRLSTAPMHPPTAPRLIPDADPWLGADKLRHFAVSYAATVVAFGAARAAGLGQGPSLTTAGLTAIGAGVGKELHDRGRAGETASRRDLVWDLLGVAAGLALSSATR